MRLISSQGTSLAEIVNGRQAGRYARRGAESIAQPARQNSSRGARFGVKPVRRLRPHGEPRVKTVVITDEDLEKAKVQGSQFIAIRESKHRTWSSRASTRTRKAGPPSGPTDCERVWETVATFSTRCRSDHRSAPPNLSASLRRDGRGDGPSLLSRANTINKTYSPIRNSATAWRAALEPPALWPVPGRINSRAAARPPKNSEQRPWMRRTESCSNSIASTATVGGARSPVAIGTAPWHVHPETITPRTPAGGSELATAMAPSECPKTTMRLLSTVGSSVSFVTA